MSTAKRIVLPFRVTGTTSSPSSSLKTADCSFDSRPESQLRVLIVDRQRSPSQDIEPQDDIDIIPAKVRGQAGSGDNPATKPKSINDHPFNRHW